VTKVCQKCGDEKPIEDFYPKSRKSQYENSKAGVSHRCRPCDQNRRLESKYGVTLDQYNQMFIDQKGHCAGCGRHQKDLTKKLCVDHNHASGQVRGLLCGTCNVALGMLRESKQTLSNLIDYLTKSELAVSNVVSIDTKKVG
jgi:Recombination endonuclease VII